MTTTKLDLTLQLYKTYSGTEPIETTTIPASGSGRQYFRFKGKQKSILAAINPIVEENEAYIAFTKHFKKYNVPVPQIELVSDDSLCYLVEDLGDDSLYKQVLACNGQLTPHVIGLYKKSLKQLINMQVDAGKTLDYAYCYPVSTFNDDAIQWDLNYFKYNFLKLAGTDFNEYLLEEDFRTLKGFLLKTPMDYFMFRDFQSRNIIIKNNNPYFIDFQGGRKGPLTYDVASLLYQAKAQLPESLRLELFDYYYKELSTKISVEYSELLNSFKMFALLRNLQVLGAYGFRGYFEKKPHFLESIPYALHNLKQLLQDADLPIDLPHLVAISEKLLVPKQNDFKDEDKLTVSITSFSYRKGMPSDPSENGGGFVFDCRSIHNPGRYDEYKTLTGKDKPVIDFFEKENEMEAFLKDAFSLVDTSVNVYQKRNFKHLMVSFGCTGGQHRSVYSAERLAAHLMEKYSLNIILWHREQD